MQDYMSYSRVVLLSGTFTDCGLDAAQSSETFAVSCFLLTSYSVTRKRSIFLLHLGYPAYLIFDSEGDVNCGRLSRAPPLTDVNRIRKISDEISP